MAENCSAGVCGSCPSCRAQLGRERVRAQADNDNLRNLARTLAGQQNAGKKKAAAETQKKIDDLKKKLGKK